MSFKIVKHPEEIVVKPTTYDVTIKFTQEQLDWFASFLGSIGGNYPPERINSICHRTTPLREITDPLYYTLCEHVKDKVDVTKFNYVTKGDVYHD